MSEISNNTKFTFMAAKWPSAIVARKKIEEFTGGLISPGYIANLDSQGKGPSGRIQVGRQIAYPVSSIILWLESRCKEIHS